MSVLRIRVQFFGPAREAAKADHAFVEIRPPATVGDVMDAVRGAIPAITELEGARLRVAVNAEYVGRDHLLKPGDVVSVIPPVGGG